MRRWPLPRANSGLMQRGKSYLISYPRRRASTGSCPGSGRAGQSAGRRTGLAPHPTICVVDRRGRRGCERATRRPTVGFERPGNMDREGAIVDAVFDVLRFFDTRAADDLVTPAWKLQSWPTPMRPRLNDIHTISRSLQRRSGDRRPRGRQVCLWIPSASCASG